MRILASLELDQRWWQAVLVCVFLHLAGCGGGGGDGNASANADSGALAGNGTTAVSAGSNPVAVSDSGAIAGTAPAGAAGSAVGSQTGTPAKLPPARGLFGGGQGKILFVEGGDRPKQVFEMDLATRSIQTRATPDPSVFFRLQGGVSRADDGTFVVVGSDPTVLGSTSRIFHYQSNGALLRTIRADRSINQNVSISPDGRSIAYAAVVSVRVSDVFPFFADALRVYIIDLAGGVVVSGDLIAATVPPANKSDMKPWVLWSRSSELYALSTEGLYKVDRSSGAGVQIHSIKLESPAAPTMSPDDRSVSFELSRGNPFGPAIWSLDISSGALQRRSIRSRSGGQYSAAYSPDGSWLLMQETALQYAGIAVLSSFFVTAIAVADPPFDTEELQTVVLNAAGKPFTAQSRMVWY